MQALISPHWANLTGKIFGRPPHASRKQTIGAQATDSNDPATDAIAVFPGQKTNLQTREKVPRHRYYSRKTKLLRLEIGSWLKTFQPRQAQQRDQRKLKDQFPTRPAIPSPAVARGKEFLACTLQKDSTTLRYDRTKSTGNEHNDELPARLRPYQRRNINACWGDRGRGACLTGIPNPAPGTQTSLGLSPWCEPHEGRGSGYLATWAKNPRTWTHPVLHC